jgi:hypothetical protein
VSRELTSLADYICDLPQRRSVLPLLAWSTGVALATVRLNGAYTVTDAVRHGAAWAERVGRVDDGDLLATLAHDDAPNEDLACDIREWFGASQQVAQELATATLALITACDGAQRPRCGRPGDSEPVA